MLQEQYTWLPCSYAMVLGCPAQSPSLWKQAFQSSSEYRRLSCLAFPNHDHPVPKLAQFARLPAIASDIRGELLDPESGVTGRRRGRAAAAVAVPVTSVNKDYCFEFWKNQVRLAGKFFVVEFVTKTICEKKFPNQHLRLCVLAFDLAHVETSRQFVVNICHVF